MITQHAVDEFLRSKSIAVVGVSRNKNKFGYAAYKGLKDKGYNVFPVNPNLSEVDSEKCFPNLSSIGEKVEGVLLVIPPSRTGDVVKEAHKLNVKSIWFQQGSSSGEAISLCEKEGISYVDNECILMFAEPVNSLHKFHRFINRIFGKLPSK